MYEQKTHSFIRIDKRARRICLYKRRSICDVSSGKSVSRDAWSDVARANAYAVRGFGNRCRRIGFRKTHSMVF